MERNSTRYEREGEAVRGRRKSPVNFSVHGASSCNRHAESCFAAWRTYLAPLAETIRHLPICADEVADFLALEEAPAVECLGIM